MGAAIALTWKRFGGKLHVSRGSCPTAELAMKVTSRCLSYLRLDQTYCLLNARGVNVVLELFKAIDIRGEMALDGMEVGKL